jgi:hypothetical protein
MCRMGRARHNEASADTRALVEQYLETDPELAKLAKETRMTELIKDIPIPLTEKDKLEAFKEARRIEFLRTVFIVVTICSMLLAGGALILKSSDDTRELDKPSLVESRACELPEQMPGYPYHNSNRHDSRVARKLE